MTYVLVPGAWTGAWIWSSVARRLRQAGHDVYPMTLTGVGDRVHLGGPQVNLDTHVADIVNLMAYEDLRDVVLVGHSYGACPVTMAADQAGDRLSHVVYLDSAPLPDGQGMLDFSGPDEAAQLRRKVAERGDGWKLPYPGFEQLGPPPLLDGLGPAERASLDGKSTHHPFGAYEQKLRLGQHRGNPQRVLIACNGFLMLEQLVPPLAAFLTPAWQRHDLPTSHWPMLSAPDALADTLLRLRR
jgi:pimeloyl-ACP methyl ester carboxylesterase